MGRKTQWSNPPRIAHPLYITWLNMRKRCLYPKNNNYYLYGARGIRVCERWDEFWNFVEDMGPKPAGTTLDRRDNDGHYCKENCRWATSVTQQRNQRRTRMLTYGGETLPLRVWAERIGKDPSTIFQRIKRWGDAGALRPTDFVANPEGGK